jgi:hypothetical protein
MYHCSVGLLVLCYLPSPVTSLYIFFEGTRYVSTPETPFVRYKLMFSDATPPARNHQRSNRIRLVPFLGLTSVLLCFVLLNACSVGNSASMPASSPQEPKSDPHILVVSGKLPSAVEGANYNSTLNVSGGKAPYTFSVSWGDLPSGVALSKKTGTISGVPSDTGTFSFGIHVTDSTNLGGANAFQMTVSNPTTVQVTVTPSTATVDSSGTMQFSASLTNTSDVAVTWSANVGTISSSGLYHAPSVSSNTAATVTATSVAQPTSSGASQVTVTPPGAPSLSITTSGLSSATSGIPYSYLFAATGGKAPYSWSISSGSLPTGITLQDSLGTISGTTTKTGSFVFSAEVKDSSSPEQSSTKSFTLTVNKQISTNPGPSPNYFGFSESDTNGGGWPSSSYGMQRIWDSPCLQWPCLNTAAGVFDFTALDSDFALAKSKGADVIMYTLARTPTWASSKPTDTSCNYTTGMGGGDGECDPPYDLNADGSGSNATWKAWITALASHENATGYSATHAVIKYYEIWNEPDTKAFFAGSFAQLARMTEDANCIITGRGVIHENGNGTATPCTATPIDPTAQIVMASAHAKGLALTYGQNELYCNNTSRSPSYQLPCPNPANAIATAVDIINFHMKPGNESGNNCPAPTPCTPEAAMQMYVSNIHGILQPAELAKPLWDGEAQYSMNGWSGEYLDGDMAASFMPRFYLVNWSIGITGMAWYSSSDKNEPSEGQTSYQQTYDWMSGSTLSTPCAATGTVWSCGITQTGKQYLVMWDTSQTCSSGSCPTKNQIVGSQYSQYQDMTTASKAISISGNTVPVGIKPIVLQ